MFCSSSSYWEAVWQRGTKEKPIKRSLKCKDKPDRVLYAFRIPFIKFACFAGFCLECRMVRTGFSKCRQLLKEIRRIKKNRKACKLEGKEPKVLKSLHTAKIGKDKAVICAGGELMLTSLSAVSEAWHSLYSWNFQVVQLAIYNTNHFKMTQISYVPVYLEL